MKSFYLFLTFTQYFYISSCKKINIYDILLHQQIKNILLIKDTQIII